jgi:hypothetical protein
MNPQLKQGNEMTYLRVCSVVALSLLALEASAAAYKIEFAATGPLDGTTYSGQFVYDATQPAPLFRDFNNLTVYRSNGVLYGIDVYENGGNASVFDPDFPELYGNQITFIDQKPVSSYDYDEFTVRLGLQDGRYLEMYFTTDKEGLAGGVFPGLELNGSDWWTDPDSFSLWDGTSHISTGFTYQVSAVPIPGAFWLFGSALMALTGVKRRSHSQTCNLAR